MNQWRDRFAEHLPSVKVGYCRRDRCDTGDTHDVVIGMVQSLLARDYGRDFYESFGLVLTDEVHRMGAPLWHQTQMLFPAKYRLGVSATPTRPDGMHHVFFGHIGPIAHRLKGADIMTPALKKVATGVSIPPNRYVQPWNRRPNQAKLINALASHEERNNLILRTIKDAHDSGRRILALTDRVKHVALLVSVLNDVDRSQARRYVGGMKEQEQEHALEAEVVVGTYPMAQEGLDDPSRDTLFLLTPKSRVKQAVGRIMRPHPEKKEPIVVDFVDERIGICAGMFRTRTREYTALNLRVR